MPQKVVWDDIEWEPVSDQVSRKVIMGSNMILTHTGVGTSVTCPVG